MSYLYDFASADESDKDLLGGKGASLAAMTNLDLPVPPGFTITTDVCRIAMEKGELPPDLWSEV
ncbi:MAG TPA: PEP/pyruvate-binding domain-containing protein, partial [Acidimicrobiia bacterium]|nr:PEP/pyruvate-binding domain-containing protein [Acidimicrobiia bacterium]